MNNEPIKTPIDRLYASRERFTIIGLTGLAGSGCSRLASAITNKDFYKDSNLVRKPSDIAFECKTKVTNTYQEEETANILSTSQLIFKREYTICYDFISKHYGEYKLLKYTRVVLLYCLLYAIDDNIGQRIPPVALQRIPVVSLKGYHSYHSKGYHP